MSADWSLNLVKRTLNRSIHPRSGLKLNLAIDYEKNTNLPEKIEKIKELMIEVRDKHTYINRCNYILEYIGKYYNINE